MPLAIEQFLQSIEKQPALLEESLSFIEYMVSPSGTRLAEGKKQKEFCSVVLLLVENVSLTEPMKTFLAEQIFLFLVWNAESYLQKYLGKIYKAKNLSQKLKLLKAILNHSIIPKKNKQDSESRYISQTQKNSQSVVLDKAETFASSTPPKKWKTWLSFPKKNKKLSQHNRQETILSTRSPLQDQELEKLRVETLVSFNTKTPMVAWQSIAEKLDNIAPKDIVNTINGIARHKLSVQQKKSLDSLKNILLVRSKLLVHSSILINIISQGTGSFEHTLKRLSNITDNSSFNQKINIFFRSIVEQKLEQHTENFRKHLENCKSTKDLQKLIEGYSFTSKTSIKKYPYLKVIFAVTNILQDYQRTNKLNRAMNWHLGRNGEVNIKLKLSRLLLTNNLDQQILHKIVYVRELRSLIGALQELNTEKKMAATVNKIIKVLQLFLDKNRKVAFFELKVGLNFLSESLAEKIVSIVRQGLQKELHNQVSNVMFEQEIASQKLERLLEILENPRYHEEQIHIFGITTALLKNKIERTIANQVSIEKALDQHFPTSKFTHELRNLVLQSAQQQSFRQQKTVESCSQELQEIQKKWQQSKIHLKSEIVKLLKRHGQIDFSQNNTRYDGYMVARNVQEFYNDPKRTVLSLPDTIKPSFANLLKAIIDQERQQQLQKLR